MKNILSFIPGTKFSGKEILDWANYQIVNQTSHYKQGCRVMERFWNLQPDRKYIIKTKYTTDGRCRIRHFPIVIRFR